jgi:hypothetical protein
LPILRTGIPHGGTIGEQQGVHGIAVAPELNKGFISNGRANKVTVFDLKTLKQTGESGETGRNPDAICYEPKTKRVFTFNGRGKNTTAINAAGPNGAIFGNPYQLALEAFAIVVVAAFAFFGSYALFKIVNFITPVRVTAEEEERGLDLSEHGEEAYST